MLSKSASKEYVKISFIPDYEFFGLKFNESLRSIAYGMMVGIFASTVLYAQDSRLFINGIKIKINSLLDYAKLFIQHDGWELDPIFKSYSDAHY